MNLPDEVFIQQLRSDEFIQALENVEPEENLPSDLIAGAGLMKNYLLEHSELPGKEMSERLGIDRTRLYRGVSPTYGPPPPFEAVWRPDQANTTALLQQIAELYHRSGLAQSPEAHERLDYIGIELAFIEYLASEEAALGRPEMSTRPGNCSVARLNLSRSILPFGFRRLLPKPWNSRRRISIAAIWVCCADLFWSRRR